MDASMPDHCCLVMDLFTTHLHFINRQKLIKRGFAKVTFHNNVQLLGIMRRSVYAQLQYRRALAGRTL